MLLPFHVAVLETKRFIANRGDLAFSIALPILLFALMQGIVSGDVSFSGTAHIVDLDDSELSNRLIEVVGSIDGVEVEEYTEEGLADAIDRAAVLTGIVIPSGFEASLRAGEPASLILRKRGQGGDEGQIVAQIVEGVARQLAAPYEVTALAKAVLADEGVSDAEVEATVAELFADLDIGGSTVGGGGPEDGAAEESDFGARILPGILVMFLLFSVTLNAQAIVEERKNGTLERLLTTRLGATNLFLGKWLAGIFRAMVQVFVLLGLTFIIVRPAGPIALVEAIVFSVFVAAAVSGLGLVIATISRTPDQASWAAVFLTMFMTIFGGTFFPVPDSGPLAIVSHVTVSRYAIDALDALIEQTGTLAGQLPEMAIMLGVAAVSLVVARSLFRVGQAR